MTIYLQLVYSHPTSRPCTTSAPFAKKSEVTDSQWPLITSTKCFLQMLTTHRVTTGVDWFGTVFLNTKKQSRTLPKLLDSTRQMQFTGITAPVAIATQECKFYQSSSFFRLEDSIYDFNRAIELDDRNPIIYSNRGLVFRKMD